MTTMEDTLTGGSAASLASARRRLPLALIGNAPMRIAGGASGVLVGLYLADLADLANRGAPLGAALVGSLGAVSFTAELLLAVPAGMLSDAIAPRALMTGGAILGAVATQLFGMSGWVSVFFLSRALEGIAAAAGVPRALRRCALRRHNGKPGTRHVCSDAGVGHRAPRAILLAGITLCPSSAAMQTPTAA